MSENKNIVTRFAPSPTGFMHVGGVRTALYAWIFARKNNGKFILRIEDTDKEREVAGSIEHIIESLKWLGIEWDEGVDIGGPNAPYKQSDRLDSYKKYAQILIGKGLAYTDPYTEEELEALREKSESEKKAFLYRDYRPENPPAWDGTKPLRFKITNLKTVEWYDEVRGDLKAGEESLDDFILIKSDGYPTYNFAHIIDDYEMGVTHIMRADEFISSTPKFLALYEALEIERPKLVTLPPIMAADGKKKLGKRDGAKDILAYRDEGYLPEAMMNFLALIGWNPGGEDEIFSKEKLIELFDISRIHKSGGGFNEEKLKWFNKEYIKLQSNEDHIKYIKKFLPNIEKYSNELLNKLRPILVERINCYSELKDMYEAGELDYYLNSPIFDNRNEESNIEKIIWKKSDKENTLLNLNLIKNILEKYQETNSEDLESFEKVWNDIYVLAEEKGKGDILWPLRYSLSGKEKSPDPKSILYIIGIKESLKRIENSINLLK